MKDEIKPGDWIVIKATGYGRFNDYGAGQVKRVTAKMVYATAAYRTQHSRDNVIVMPDEASARLLVDRITSAKAEANERIRSIEDAARSKIAKMLLDAIREGQTDANP